MANTWDAELFRRSRYEAVFALLLKRAAASPHLIQSAPGYPEFTLAWTLRNQDLVVRTLRKSIRDDAFRLSSQTLIKIKTDKVRDIYQANWPERVLLMVMANILKEKTDFLVRECVYSFRRGRGPWNALHALADFVRHNRSRGPVWLLKRDIKKYGDTIPQAPLLDKLLAETDLPRDSRYYALLRQGVSCLFAPREDPAALACLRLGIPSGSPLVPPLENFYLTPLDGKLSGTPGLFYGRYGDDFVCASASPIVIAQAREDIVTVVQRLGLATKVEKAMDLELGPQTAARVVWLGASVNFRGQLGMKPAHLREIRDRLRAKVRNLVVRVGKFDIDEATKTQVLAKGFAALLNRRTQSDINRLLGDHSEAQRLRDLDRDLYRWVVADLQRHWRIRKRPAWRIARKLRLPSLTFLKIPASARKGNRHVARRSAA